jgi:hypothetical protein
MWRDFFRLASGHATRLQAIGSRWLASLGLADAMAWPADCIGWNGRLLVTL